MFSIIIFLSLSFFSMRACPTVPFHCQICSIYVEHFNKTGVCVRICSLDYSDSSGWIVLSCLLLWSSVEKVFYIYKAWHESAMNFSARSLFSSHLRTRTRMFGSAEHPRVFRTSCHLDFREGGAPLFHCFGGTCTMSLCELAPKVSSCRHVEKLIFDREQE